MVINYHGRFLKKFAKLDFKIQKAFQKRLFIFKISPYSRELENHTLSGKYFGCRSINITGDYRAIYTENHGNIVFLKVGTHHELYGK